LASATSHLAFVRINIAPLLCAAAVSLAADTRTHDVIVYGGTAGGAIAAVAAAREGKSVVLLEPRRHIGGMVSGGLGWTDTGRRSTIGGYAKEFFNRMLAHYVATCGNDSQQVKDCSDGYYFEPHVAENVFRAMLAEAKVTVVFDARLNLAKIEKAGKRIVAVTTLGGRRFQGGVFIDATYEGDLMAASGVSCRVGREAQSEYGEEHAMPRADKKVQAYNFRICLTQRDGNRLPIPKPAAYDPALYENLAKMLQRQKPPRLDGHILKIDPLPNNKTDINNGGSHSTDWTGHSWDYPEGDYATRDRIWAEHRNYNQGLLWFLGNDPRVPENLRREMLTWGFCRDEFQDTGGWPHQLYVREARRMTGLHVMTERNVRDERYSPHAVCLGSYTIDCHGMGPGERGMEVRLKGAYEIPYGVLSPRAGEIENLLVPVCCSATHVAYCSMRMEPVYMMLGHAAGVAAAMAASGQTAVQRVNVAALRDKLAAQKQVLIANRPPIAAFDAPVTATVGEPVKFTDRSRDDQGLKTWAWDFDGNGSIDSTRPNPAWTYKVARAYSATLIVNDGEDRSDPATRRIVVTGGPPPPDDVLVDDEQAVFTGRWARSSSTPGFVGKGYHHDAASDKGQCRARFTPAIQAAGVYTVLVFTAPTTNRSTNTLVVIHHAGGEKQVRISQRSGVLLGNFRNIGSFPFAAGRDGWVEIRNDGTEGHVIADGVRFIYTGPLPTNEK
jgi:hypothetical protein